jgi:hypothetical protein
MNDRIKNGELAAYVCTKLRHTDCIPLISFSLFQFDLIRDKSKKTERLTEAYGNWQVSLSTLGYSFLISASPFWTCGWFQRLIWIRTTLKVKAHFAS